MSNDVEWTLLDSQYLLRERDLVVRKDWLQRSDNGMRFTKCTLEYSDWVNAFAMTREGSVIFVRQYRNSVREQTMEIPGGGVESRDENPEAAIRRELMEETGFVFDEVIHLISVFPNPAIQTNRLHCFLALGGRPVSPGQTDNDEHIEVAFLSPSMVESMLSSGKLLDNGHLTCVFYALLKLQRLKLAVDITP